MLNLFITKKTKQNKKNIVMGEQIKGEDWLPEGWKVEIRVRKSGKKDRYYTDPVNGYIFRSLKDIDRYLLSGKLGKHVTKNKPKNLEFDDPNFDFVEHIEDVPSLPKKKKSSISNVANKSCQISVQRQEKAEDESKTEKCEAENSNEIVKKPVSRSSKGGRGSRPKKKRESTPFFMLDPEQCEDSNALSIPNLSEIIDLMLKEKEGPKTVYLSAPDIGSLLGEKLLDSRIIDSNNGDNSNNKKPKFDVNKCKKDNGSSINSNKLSCVTIKETVIKKDELGYNYEESSSDAVEKSSVVMVDETKAKEEPAECLQFDDLFDDPCIDFAIKTLTAGSSLFGG